jgi:hypothetical protein
MMTGSARARLLISPINYEKSFMGSSKRGGHLPSVCFRAGNAAALLE